MKKLISTMAVAAMLFAGVVSCTKSNVAGGEEGIGRLTVAFSIDNGSTNTTRAVKSTAKPVTTWANVSNMMILFVDQSTNKVVDARSITPPASGVATKSETFTDVRANNVDGWDTYIVGNHPSAWNTGNVVGRDITSTLAAQLAVVAPASTTYAGSPMYDSASNGMDEAPEVFVAKQEDIKLAAGENKVLATPFRLTRAVSLVRVRVDQAPDVAPANATIDFAAATTIFSVRRAATTYNLAGTYTYTSGEAATIGTKFPGTFTPATPAATNVFYKEEALKSVAPATGYENGTTLLTPDITLWNDYLIWSGGGTAAENAKRFDIVLGGVTKEPYVTREGNTVPAGTKVYWTGAVSGNVGPNQILELMIELRTAGSSVPPIVVGEYANLDITVDIVPWGDIIGVDMPM